MAPVQRGSFAAAAAEMVANGREGGQVCLWWRERQDNNGCDVGVKERYRQEGRNVAVKLIKHVLTSHVLV